MKRGHAIRLLNIKGFDVGGYGNSLKSLPYLVRSNVLSLFFTSLGFVLVNFLI